MNAVEITGLSHVYGTTRAVRDVSLSIPAGAFVSVVGPSGCGKSTLLKVMAGLLVPQRGSVTVAGRPVIGGGSWARPGATVGYMAQRDLLLPWKRVLDNACLGAVIGGADRAATRDRALGLLDRFGLTGFERAWPSQLSGGMRQRLALLRTHLTDAPVMALDEPFGALDAITRRDLQDWMQHLWVTDRGTRSALLITHDVEEALYLSDTVYVMSARPGTLIGSVTNPARRPRDPSLVTDPDFVARKTELLALLDAGRGAAGPTAPWGRFT
ncbi:MAG: ABC transporter ATP-binding protein [Acidimicrobiales bacterium]